MPGYDHLFRDSSSSSSSSPSSYYGGNSSSSSNSQNNNQTGQNSNNQGGQHKLKTALDKLAAKGEGDTAQANVLKQYLSCYKTFFT